MPTLRQLLSTPTSIPRHFLKNWLLFVIQKNASFLISNDDYALSDDELQKFNDGLLKLQAGMPLAYLAGTQGFWRYEFMVNEYTLIPRADSEILIETALELIKEMPNPSILDLGTGTGCLAISLDLELPTAQVTAVDFSLNALEIAKQNNDNLNANVNFIHSNWFEHIAGQFELIISNPPYIAGDDEHLKDLTFEPITALTSDDNGLADIKKIVNGAKNHLINNGYLLLEHGYNQKQSVQMILAQAGFCDVRTIQDYGGNDRVTLGQWHYTIFCNQ